ncbi:MULTISPECIES: pyruvate, phosphate dikinase [Pelosinus]|uniref:Pyruvate, phosphate dikinase n=1 Tax=Pelosinus fermentans B4 TaxID=1149862 RepID=I9AS49_9FIRM|nr:MULTISPECIES: pyruvate, phosphate dikinase [Pelosinus]EIW15772.1 pyruvate, phosphate dikinase [Pelosinus fermentans B4]EIW27522.1 pyruvate, phosphate dikinase [Pelosinus fermentans A11]OAM92508.1 pyruvate, phosphate dikinase [Pelosinus fermentans DSM 17108]SDQ47202.1 pyruvate phosphate dikinase [Pelosinus fermentans]
MKKFVYLFDQGSADMRSLLGGKGANLAEMTNIGLPVPPGMTITTAACKEYYENGKKLPSQIIEEVRENLAHLENTIGKKLGDVTNPLLVSVRSGAVFSMPGMMDTILNLGLNEKTVQAVAKSTNNLVFAYDSYRRFIQMFGDVVLEIHKYEFEQLLTQHKKKQGVTFDQEMSADTLRAVIDSYKELILEKTGEAFPEDPMEQLFLSIEAVFRSWNNERAFIYRNLNKIDHDLGTAVNIQSMVFGNMGDDCGTGVAFTRNPSNGENLLYGEYLTNAQGEDVVAGIRTPQPIAKLAAEMPQVYAQFAKTAKILEKHYKNVQDIEFTIEKGTLYILQTRNGKRTAQAGIKIAHDLAAEGLITKQEALLLIEPGQLDQLLHRQIDPNAKLDIMATGLPASPGAASGIVVFDANHAEELGKKGQKVMLVRTETTPDDIHGIIAAQGILTSRGGMTSHAAVVARGMGKPCVCGCEAVKINYHTKTFTIGETIIKEGDLISIDGATGRVIAGVVPMKDPELSTEYLTLLQWADEYKKLEVRANADNPADAQKALDFGAKGIGLTRTEHMFMGQDRLPHVQEMILAENFEERQTALTHLLPMQEEDFYGILKVMAGYPVCIRLLDPPLHEFLPSMNELLIETTTLQITQENMALLAQKEALLKKVRALHESNPMLGHRGCRLGITFPEIYEMQIQAICNAAARLTTEGYKVLPEIEIPLTIGSAEMNFFKEKIDTIAKATMEKYKVSFHYTSGTMIELPRAALLAGELAEAAEFFSFGTNDLTQTCLGFSRDDAEGKFLNDYLDMKLLPDNPFITIDRKGVGKLMEIAVESGRKTRPDILIGICGEHGGEARSIEFCHQIGLDFVSCSPYRVPIARLAAAQAAISKGENYGTK